MLSFEKLEKHLQEIEITIMMLCCSNDLIHDAININRLLSMLLSGFLYRVNDCCYRMTVQMKHLRLLYMSYDQMIPYVKLILCFCKVHLQIENECGKFSN